MIKPRAGNLLETKEQVSQGRASAGPVGKVVDGRGQGSQGERSVSHGGSDLKMIRKREKSKAICHYKSLSGSCGSGVKVWVKRTTRKEIHGKKNMRSEREEIRNWRGPGMSLKAVWPIGQVGTGNAAADASCAPLRAWTRGFRARLGRGHPS
jgi:hypothetical protein